MPALSLHRIPILLGLSAGLGDAMVPGWASAQTAYSGSRLRAMTVATSTTELNLYPEYTSLYGTPTTAVNMQVTVIPKGVLARSTVPAAVTRARQSSKRVAP